MNKEYFQKYYKDHKEGYRKRGKEWIKNNPQARKAIKDTYYQKNKEHLKEYSRDYHKAHSEDINRMKRKPYETRTRAIRVLGVRIKEKELKPFMERISPELRAKIEENTKVNNEKIRYYTDEIEDAVLVRGLMKMKETRAEN